MFSKKLLYFILIAGGVALAGFGALSGRLGPKAESISRPSPTPSGENSGKNDFPIVEFASQRPSSPERLERSKKYDSMPVLNPEIKVDDNEIVSADWLETTDAIPVEQSSLIVAGTVLSSDAFLSADRKSVYSEFKIDVEKTFKNSSSVVFEENRFVRAERPGGIVIFPTGFRVWFRIQGQRMPTVGTRYLFFLSHRFPIYGKQERDLHLVTAYGLQNGQVRPLDNADGGSHPTALEFKGKDESTLMRELDKKLNVRSHVR